MDRTYDLFETFPGDSPLWRCTVRGLSAALAKLRQLGESSSHECYAIHLEIKEIIGRVNVPPIGGTRPMQHIALRSGVPLRREIEAQYVWKRTMWCRQCDKASYDLYAPKMQQEPELVEKHQKYLRAYMEKHCPNHFDDEIMTPEQL